jgi:hypothetical protein
MLKEIQNLQQKDGDYIHRRWFSDKQIELITWYNDNDVIIGFQLIYFIKDEEHAFTWKESDGFHCSHVDSGDNNVGKNMSPALIDDREVSINYITKLFLANCGNIDTHISQLVIEKLKVWRNEHEQDNV